MTLPTCKVICTIRDQSGNPEVGAYFEARLNSFEVYDGYVVPEVVRGTSDATGICELNLWPNELGSVESAYEVKIRSRLGKSITVVAVVPNQVSVDLHSIATLPPYPGKTEGQYFIDQAIAVRDAAAQSAQSASGSEATAIQKAGEAASRASDAAASAAAALASEGSAASSASASASSASASAASASASETSAVASASSAASSAASASTASTKAAEASASADSAAQSAATISPIPAGTQMLFMQTSAPTGWTKVTTHNNAALRVVSGTAGSGGSLDFTTAFASRGVSGTIGSTAITEAQMPWHGHSMHGAYGGGPGGGGWSWLSNNWAAIETGGKGGSQGHNHSFTGTNIDMAVKYVDAIIATKN